MPENEKYIMVEGWDDQVGGWMELDEAFDMEEAQRMVAQFASNPLNSNISHYSIRFHHRTVVNLRALHLTHGEFAKANSTKNDHVPTCFTDLVDLDI